MIKPHQGWEDYAELYEKEIEQLKNYISLLLEGKRRAQATYFVIGVAAGSLLDALLVWAMK